MNSSNKNPDNRFPWPLTQERLDRLAWLLVKLMTILNVAESGCPSAEETACLLTDLREHSQRAGAADPFPDMPMSPRFEDEDSPAGEEASSEQK